MLYMINKSPASDSLASALRIAPDQAPILLYEDGVYAVLPGAASAQRMADAIARHPVYALQADLEARGIERLLDGIQVIDYDGFVALVEEHDVAPWL